MNKLKDERQKKALSQYELGKLIGKYQSRIWQIEKGYCPPREWEKEALAKVLDVGVETLFPPEKTSKFEGN